MNEKSSDYKSYKRKQMYITFTKVEKTKNFSLGELNISTSGIYKIMPRYTENLNKGA